MIITDKFFRSALKETILYGLNNHEEKRGTGATDVLMFEHNYSNKLFK